MGIQKSLLNSQSVGLALMLLLSGCSFSVPDSRRITITFPDSPDASSQRVVNPSLAESLAQSESQMRLFQLSSGIQSVSRDAASSSYSSSFATPTSVRDFSCFGINVLGDGISKNPNLKPCSESGSLSGGLMAGMTPVTNSSISIDVPMGPNRLIQLFGIQSRSGCPSVGTLGDVTALRAGNYGWPYELGRTTVDITNDTNVVIQSKWDSSKIIPAFCPINFIPNSGSGDSGSSGSSGGTSKLSFMELDFGSGSMQVGTTFAGPVKVEVQDASGARKAGLNSGLIYLSFSTRNDCTDTIIRPDSDIVQAPIVNGVASFSNINLNVYGSTYFRAQSPGMVSRCVGPVTLAKGSTPARVELLGPRVYASPSTSPLPMRLQAFDAGGIPFIFASPASVSVSYSFSGSYGGLSPLFFDPYASSRFTAPASTWSSLPTPFFFSDAAAVANEAVQVGFSISSALTPSFAVSPSSTPIVRVIKQVNSPVSLKFAGTPASREIAVGTCSQGFTVQAADIFGNTVASLPGSITVELISETNGSVAATGLNFFSDAACQVPIVGSVVTLISGSPSATFYVKPNQPGIITMEAKDSYGWLDSASYTLAAVPTSSSGATQLLVTPEGRYDSTQINGPGSSFEMNSCRPLWIALTDDAFNPAPLSAEMVLNFSLAAPPSLSWGGNSGLLFYSDSSCSNALGNSLTISAGRSLMQIWVKKMTAGSYRISVLPSTAAIRAATFDWMF